MLRRICASTGRKRHFLDPHELIELKDERIAVCAQWGKGNIGAFIERAVELSYIVTEENQ